MPIAAATGVQRTAAATEPRRLPLPQAAVGGPGLKVEAYQGGLPERQKCKGIIYVTLLPGRYKIWRIQ